MNDPKNPANPPRQSVKLEIKTDESVAGGIYSNFMIVHSTESEFTLDFMYLLPQAPQATVRSRVILSPLQAKRLHQLLGQQVARFEKSFGEIRVPQRPPVPDTGDPSLN